MILWKSFKAVCPYTTFVSIETYSQPSSTAKSTSASYDTLGRTILFKNTDGTTQTNTFNHWKVTNKDENGHEKVYYNDAYGRITKIEEKNSGQTYTTTYEYDAADNLVKITDSKNNVFSFSYDSLGRKTITSDPDTGLWYYSYDSAGNLLTQKDAKESLLPLLMMLLIGL